MALTVYLCGHGAWRPNSGFFSLPKGCSIDFMIHFAKVLPSPDAHRLVQGTYPGAPVDTVTEFRQCPNMTWAKDTEAEMRRFYRDAGRNPKENILVLAPNDFPGRLGGARNDRYSLRDFFEDEGDFVRNAVQQYGHVHFVWACCMSLGLRKTRFGGEIGVDAGEWADRFHRLDWTGPHPFVPQLIGQPMMK